MPVQTATGLMAIPVMAMARLVASSATFRGVVGATTATEAIDKAIYWLEVEDDVDEGASPDAPGLLNCRPRAIIDWPENWATNRQGPGTWSDAGGLYLSFEFTIPKEYEGDPREESLWFLNKIGTIVDEMRTNSGGSDASDNPYLNATSFTIISNPAPCVRSEEIQQFWGVCFHVEWPG